MKKHNIFLARFVVISMMAGLFSPHLDIRYTNDKPQISVTLLSQAEAKVKRKKMNRRKARPQRPHTRPQRPHARPKPHKRKRPHYKRKPHNYYYRSHRHRDYGYYRNRRIVAFTAGLVIGSIIASATMPTTCTTVRVNGISYRRCDNTYYRPFYSGDDLVYEVVPAPY